MLRYSLKAISGLTALLRKFNDINIFVEDTAGVNMHTIYLGRLLHEATKGKSNIVRVFPLGSRNNVIKKSKDEDFVKKHSPCLFIIDGDIDIICKTKYERVNNLHRLEVYCIENFLFCESALIETAFECSNKRYEDIREEIGFQNIANQLRQYLVPVFERYAIIQNAEIGIENAGKHIYSIIKFDDIIEKRAQQKIDKYVKSLDEKIIAEIGEAEHKNLLQKIQNKRIKKDALNAISGKNYLLPVAINMLKRVSSCNDNEKTLKARFARHSKVRSSSLVNALRKTAKK